MTRIEFIKKVEELDRLLLEEVETDDFTDCARAHAHYELESVIEILKANEDGDY